MNINPNKIISRCKVSILLSFAFLYVALQFGCAGDYNERTKRALNNFQARNFDAAICGYESNKGSKKDRLLYLMNKGVVLHTAGKYAESIKILQEADDLADQIDFISISEEIASIFTNERNRTYKGEALERVLINVYKAIDYIMLGNIEDALVECRRINEKLDYFNEKLKAKFRDPFPRYISGILYEANNETNDAYIDYKFTRKIKPDFYYLPSDLLSLSKELGFLQDYDEWQRVFGPAKGKLRPEGDKLGELVLIYEKGMSPEKKSSEMKSHAQVIPIPVYHDRRSSISHAEIFFKKRLIARTHLLSDIGKLSKAYLNKRIGEYVARGVARLAVKTGAAVAVGKTVDKNLGILLGIALLYTNRADLRSVLTLPEHIHIARVFLREGTHNIRLRFRNKNGSYSPPSVLFKDVSIKKGERTFINYRTFR